MKPMLYAFLALLLSSHTFGQAYSPKIDPKKFTVCSITINSDDEKKVFAAQIAKYPAKFNPIVELTAFDERDWFQQACASGIRCDQLIISGHFGGTFFGKTDKYLQQSILEQQGCSKTCEGILNHPYEVFLFGCNTLAGKDHDSRTPEQYLQVLLRDGIDPTQAELVVQSRYGSIGDSHKSSMQRAFGGLSKQLYGFDSIGPSGTNVKKFLQDYTAKVSPAEHLERLQAKRMMGQVDLANDVLANSLRNTAFTQCEAGDLEDEVTKKICKLQDSRVSLDDKLSLTMEVLASDKYLVYIPSINNYIKSSFVNTPEQKAIIEEISKNNVIKQQISGLLKNTSSLSLSAEWSQFALSFKLVDETEVSANLTNKVRNIFSKSPREEDVDRICSLDDKIQKLVKLTLADIPDKKLKLRTIEALTCLNNLESPLESLLIENLKGNIDIDSRATILSHLAGAHNISIDHGLVLQQKAYLKGSKDDDKDAIIRFLTRFAIEDKDFQSSLPAFLNSKNDSVRQAALMAYQNELVPRNKQLQLKFVDLLNDPETWVSFSAAGALNASKPGDTEVLLKASAFFISKKDTQWPASQLLHTIQESGTKDPIIMSRIASLLSARDEVLASNAYIALTLLKPTDPEIMVQMKEYSNRK